jgi:CHASE2 domain-containing sensor protein
MAPLFSTHAFSPAAVWFGFWAIVTAFISIHHRDYAGVAFILGLSSLFFCALSYFFDLEIHKKQK